MDPHSVLGVSRSASKEEVKQAWRKAVRESHPDLHTNSSHHVQQQANERFKAVQEAYGRITSGRTQDPRHTYRHTTSAYTAQQSSGQTDWAYVRNRNAYRRHTGYGTFASWFDGSRAYTAPRAVRQQAALVLAAIMTMMTLDAATNTMWNTSNDGRLYGSVAKEAERRLNEKVRKERDCSQLASSAVQAGSSGQAGKPTESQASPSESLPYSGQQD